ncbi:glycosyltransferase family 2 protein [uncultured Brachyspira sp.]|uniref:glycosyltransferase family 2 protein n=1 Tax=uncultured Brachyspira sp. TaxID=221953 RepID=UPI00263444BA|nr:glycosyltransferase family 2 protein [uncultured Brachyspira sp.]
MNYQFTNEELLEMENKIPKYEKHEFFEKRNKYALIIAIMNEGKRFLSQIDKMKKSNIFNQCDVFICDGSDEDKLLSLDFIESIGTRKLLVNKSGSKGRTLKLKQLLYETAIDGYEGVIMVDGNNKDSVDECLHLFVEKLDEGYDLIQATRFTLGGKEENTPLLRKIGLRFIASPLISFVSGFHYDDVLNGFRAFSKRFILDKRIDLFREEFIYYEYDIYPLVHVKKLGYKACQVPTIRKYPKNEIPSKIKGIVNIKLFFYIIQNAFSKTKKIDN